MRLTYLTKGLGMRLKVAVADVFVAHVEEKIK